MKNKDIYKTDLGLQIMDPKNFSSQIIEYLECEAHLVFDKAEENNNDVIVELGSHNFRLKHQIERKLFSPYLGVDLIKTQAHPPDSLSRQIRCDVTKLVKKNFKLFSFFKRPLIVLPFNFIGNIPDEVKFLNHLSCHKSDIIISQFSLTDIAYKVRSIYYECCGFENLKAKHHKNYVQMSYQCGFTTQSFAPHWIKSFFHDKQFSHSSLVRNDVYNICLFKRNESEV